MSSLPSLFELAQAFHACKDINALGRALASHLGKTLNCSGVLVWFCLGKENELTCSARWSESGVRFDPLSGCPETGLLPAMLDEERAQRFTAEEFDDDALAHFAEHDRERIHSALYAPIIGLKGCGGVIEALNHRSGKFSADDAAYLEDAARLAARALDTMRDLEEERQESLNTIERLTSLYDISRVFNSTLELEDLLPIIADRICNILGAEACNLWLVDSDENDIYFAQQVGDDPTTDEEDRLPLGQGVIGKTAQSGQALLIADASDEEHAELLAERRKRSPEFEIRTLMAAPLLKEEEVLGVVEVVNKADGSSYTREDLFFLTSLAQQAAIALHNANLLEAERKVGELDALLAIGKEITSTLNLDHVLTTVVHQAATVVPFDQCAIGLYDRGKFILGAVSGEKEVPKTREMASLRDLLEWVGTQTEPVSANQYEGGWEVSPPEAESKVTPHLTAHEFNGFYALPLRDEQGTVGVLAMLSGDAEFLSERHLEMVGILASQTTVAIRNARLYQEVPLRSVWQPIVAKKQKLLAATRGRTLELLLKAAFVLFLLVAVPWKLRIGANATVVPAERRSVTAEVAGVIRSVAVKEGDVVEAGTVLAALDDSDSRLSLSAAQAALAVALRQLADAEARGDLAAANQARIRSELHRAEIALYDHRIQNASLRAPIRGQVVTPKVEEKLGQYLEPGSLFCEIVDLDNMAVEVNVPETQIGLVRPGTAVSLKLNAFPARTFTGSVARLSASTITAENEQFFVVRAVFPNEGRAARPGMAGRAKITAGGGWWDTGWYPIGYVIFRTPARWSWHKLWEWLP